MRTLLAVVLSLSATYCVAQAGGAELTGSIADPSGAALADAVVTITELGTSQETITRTSSAGVYSFPNLHPGMYSVRAAASGFQAAAASSVELSTGTRRTLDFTLQLESSKESVSVKADATPLDREQADLADTIEHQRIVDLPLNGRTFVSLATLSPGVALPPGTQLPRINGGRPRTNEYLYDGISALQPEPGQVAFFPVIDGIQDFNIQTNAVSAEFGRFNGGVVNLTTRTGADSFHGNIFEFLRNEALNAKNYFAPTTQAKPEFRRNQYGATLGGPIVRGKSFFFVDYQGSLQAIGTVRTSTVPTLLQRQGIFTEPTGGTVATIFDPATTTSTGTGFTRTAFPNNTIPVSRMDSAALALLNRYPLPTGPGTANNFTRVGTDHDHQNQFDARLDQRLGANNQIFGRYSYFHDVDSPATPLPDGSGAITSGVVGLSDTLGQQFVSGYTQTLSPLSVNELRFGYTRRGLSRLSAIGGGVIPGIPQGAAFNNTLPVINISGLQQLGSSSSTSVDSRTDVTEVADTFSWQRGKHFLKFGLDWRWERLDVVQPPNPQGNFTFSQLFTDQPGKTGTGNAVASFLLGQVQQFSIDLQTKVIRPRAHIQEYFAQDDWKVSRRLTVNAGLRYTLNFPSTEVDNQGAIFNLATQKLDYFGQNGFPNSARELHKDDFGPRVGFSYLLTPKTVLRSGYGLVWIEQAGITTPFTTPQFPFLQTVSQRTLDSITPAFVLASGPTVTPIPLTPDAGLGQGVFSANRPLGSGYVQQWNLAVERELTGSTTFQVAYAGSHIVHVGLPDTNINQLTPAQLATGSSLLQRVPNPFFGMIPRSSSIGDPTIPRAQLLKPFPEFTNVSLYRNNIGSTHYHAIEARLNQRVWKGLSFTFSYTRSKLIDEASSVFDASVLTGPIANFPVADSFNLRRERDSSTGDMPNVTVASYVYQFPDKRGFGSKLLSGWQAAGLITLQSGMPVAITQATNFNSFAGYGVQRPNVIGAPNLDPSQRTPQHFFNTAGFQVAPQFTLGNSSRNPVRGPAYRDGDLSLSKHTRVGERLDAEFRAEVFNLTNTPAFGQPSGTLGTAAFGSITSTASDPRVFQFAIKLNY